MKANIRVLLICLSALAPLGLSLAVWDSVPGVMATHWNWKGEADGWMPRTAGLLLIPVLDVLLSALFLVIPLVDPLRKNIAGFRKHYDFFVLIFLVFMLGVHSLLVLWAKGVRFDPLLLIGPGMGAVFLYTGVLLSEARPNWFVGIRTPWTLSSPLVWTRTHTLGAVIFKFLGGMVLVSVLFRPWAFLVVIGLALMASIFLAAYSFVLFRAEKKGRLRR
jgi:uncharacterized membrane protein